ANRAPAPRRTNASTPAAKKTGDPSVAQRITAAKIEMSMGPMAYPERRNLWQEQGEELRRQQEQEQLRRKVNAQGDVSVEKAGGCDVPDKVARRSWLGSWSIDTNVGYATAVALPALAIGVVTWLAMDQFIRPRLWRTAPALVSEPAPAASAS